MTKNIENLEDLKKIMDEAALAFLPFKKRRQHLIDTRDDLEAQMSRIEAEIDALLESDEFEELRVASVRANRAVEQADIAEQCDEIVGAGSKAFACKTFWDENGNRVERESTIEIAPESIEKLVRGGVIRPL